MGGLSPPLSHQCQVLSFENGIMKTIQNVCERLDLSAQTFLSANKSFSYHTRGTKNVDQKLENLGVPCILHLSPRK